jgi:uncharacterized protein YjbJ (UPF0337 family)
MDETRRKAMDEQIKGKFESGKGKAKEAIGNLTGDDELVGEGQADQAEGTIRDSAGRVVREGKDLVDRAKDKLRGDT